MFDSDKAMKVKLVANIWKQDLHLLDTLDQVQLHKK
jgi:hypothetical protein